MLAMKLKLLAKVFAILAIPTIILAVDAVSKRPKNMRKSVTDKHFTVRIPTMMMYIGLIGLISPAVLTFRFLMNDTLYNTASAIAVTVSVGVLFVLALDLIFETLSTKTVIYYDTISVYRPLKKTSSFNFSDITLVKAKQTKYYYFRTEKLTIVTTDGKKAKVNSMEENYDRLCRLLKTKVPNELFVGFEQTDSPGI